MTRSAKLWSSIIVALFIAIMIPVAIFATQREAALIQNNVKFYVEDLEGEFYYAITGNSPDNGLNSSLDVGYNAVSDTINPALVFQAEYVASKDDYVVYDALSSKIASETISINQNKGLEFDINHTKINYYFVFINHAEYFNAENTRSVFVTATAEHSINQSQVRTYWSYITKTATQPNIISTSPLNTTGEWTTSINDPIVFHTGIEVKAKEEANYSYIILRYTLELLSTTNELSQALNLTVSLNKEPI